MTAYLVVAVFRDWEGKLGSPEIWLGAVGESARIVVEYWTEHLDNFDEGNEPIPSHILAVESDGRSQVLPWKSVIADFSH